ncbi:hypothetical protein KZ483_23220 [Paenibacillus sp. sptzw28]|uniref:hypothetical protein n=1 Tax=Paenibacillus sp. sptzw28 TaxID=715179 RepID=UPI001C6F0542|nr:hypothetical protein [Paenibacillus sp. sptzw28]QYR20667.1 hypothetical protein KZ483_23220 [Paenibacillus sp. sptzw28]
MDTKSYSRKKSRSIHLLIVALIALTAVTAGCSGSSGSTNNPGTEEGGVTNDGGGNGGQSGHSGMTEPDTAKPKPSQPGNNRSDEQPPKDTAVSKAEGTYVGQADTHSVEIKTADGTSVFQFDASLAEKVDKIKDNSPVAIEYYSKEYNIEGKNVKQLWLTKIEALGS